MSASRIAGADGWEAGPLSVSGSGRRIGVLQQIGHRVDAIDRRLHRDRIVHVVLRVEEEIRRHQHARRQRRQDVVGDIALRDVQLGGAQPIHVHLQRRIVQHLHQMRVGHAGNRAHALQQLLAKLRWRARSSRPGSARRSAPTGRSSAPARRYRRSGNRRRCRGTPPAAGRGWRGCSRSTGGDPASARSGSPRPSSRHCHWARRPG